MFVLPCAADWQMFVPCPMCSESSLPGQNHNLPDLFDDCNKLAVKNKSSHKHVQTTCRFYSVVMHTRSLFCMTRTLYKQKRLHAYTHTRMLFKFM